MSNKNRKIMVKKDIVLRKEDDGAFLFDPETGRICYLNETGVFIWRLCNQPTTKDRIIKELYSEYADVSKEKVTDDCKGFIAHLDQFGFLSKEIKD